MSAEKENEGPSASKKPRTAYKEASKRWNFIEEEEEVKLIKKFVPKNTMHSTKWALRNYTAWKDSRNNYFSDNPEKKVPEDLLETADDSSLCKWLTLYVTETCKQDGSKYPPKTLYSLLTGLLRYCREVNPDCPNFLNSEDHRFQALHNSIDNIMRELRQSGIGSKSKATEVFTKEDENKLWESNVLGIENPKALLRAVFFLNGKNLCLRGGEEHRKLKISQIIKHQNGYLYTENSSKNRSGGLAQMQLSNKSVPIYPVPEAGNRCHVKILDVYFSKLPKDAFSRDNFYLQPLPITPANPDNPWFSITPVGKNTLANMVKDICKDVKISGNKTNHSLRATGASSMFQAGVPEKIIQQWTGHRSLPGLRQYERTTIEQQKAVCKVLSSEKKESYSTFGQSTTTTSLDSLSSNSNACQSSTAPTFNFTGCSVMFCQGGLPLPPPPAAPAFSQPSLDFDFDMFLAD